tara:strand:- start:80 stop:298 length:219 start_codon:yes stop_codon:yes gene_type:complete
MKKAPGTSGLMPVKGSGCGIRPDVEKMEDSEGFDFSGAASLLNPDDDQTEKSSEKSDQPEGNEPESDEPEAK